VYSVQAQAVESVHNALAVYTVQSYINNAQRVLVVFNKEMANLHLK
jgi:hypothetical protein